jgi:hypothetical protein
MTIKTNNKTDPKGNLKPTKKSKALSSSLAVIMKSGGVAVGAKAAKSAGNLDKMVKGTGNYKNDDKGNKNLSTDIGYQDAAKERADMIKDNDLEMLEVDTQTDFRKTSDGARFEAGSNARSWDRDQGVGDDQNQRRKAEEDVNKWQGEVKRIEALIPGATSKERKESLEIQMTTAHMMLKESLLRLSVLMKDSNHETMQSGNSKGIMEGYIEADMVEHVEFPLGQDVSSDEDIIMEKGDNINKSGDVDSTEMVNTKRNFTGINWADLSDDDTVVLDNRDNEEWHTVSNKKGGIKADERNKTEGLKEEKNKLKQGEKGINNPYKKQEDNQTMTPVTQPNHSSGSPSLASYLKSVQGKQRSPNLNSIRMTTSFTPRVGGNSDFKRVAKELLNYAMEFDPDVLLLPWDDKNATHGPISVQDLANPNTMVEAIKYYFNKPTYVNLQPGIPAYGIGVRFTTDLEKYEFINKWNLQKREYKQQNRVAYTVTLAATQKSTKAFIIGIAVGSSEDQDFELLNARLEKETGIKGIEVSYQNINQIGITQEFWKLANSKASKVNSDKMSRDHLRMKYLWAPNALAIYVPSREEIAAARKIMIHKYGKTTNGNDPVWPDGSSMRFLPIKGSAIKNEKTKEIVRKRMAFHIWLKANEIILDTNLANIHNTIPQFDNRTFSDIILGQTDKEGQRVFKHFNRAWSSDPSEQKWSLSVYPYLVSEARHILNNMKETLYDQYGPDIDQFFRDDTSKSSWAVAVSRNVNNQEDDDDWFDDDEDITEMVNKGIVDSSFLQFLAGKADEDDKQSVASWGTGDTAYTEICTNIENTDTSTSSITQEPQSMSEDEKDKRKDIVRVRLMMKGIPDKEINDIMENKHPYDLAFSGISLLNWDADKEVFLIMALRELVNKQNNVNDE